MRESDLKYVLAIITLVALIGTSVAQEVSIPRPDGNIWCRLNGEWWQERGAVCHVDPAQRAPVVCTATFGSCAFPRDRKPDGTLK